MNEIAKPNEVHFLTWSKPDITKGGEVKLEKDGKQMKLSYSSDVFTAQVEEIALSDRSLSNVWGKQIYRIILKDKKLRKKGNYQFRIEAL